LWLGLSRESSDEWKVASPDTLFSKVAITTYERDSYAMTNELAHVDTVLKKQTVLFMAL